MDLKLTVDGDIKKLDLEPGDVVVVRLHARVPVETMERVSKIVKSKIGTNNEVVVLDEGSEIEIIKPQRE